MTLIYFFKISFLLGALLPFFVGFVVLLKNKNNERNVNISFFLLSVSSAIWSLGFLLLINSTSYATAYIWRTIMDFGTILLPAFWIHFVLAILGEDKSRFRTLFFVYSIAIIIAVLNVLEIFYPGIFITKLEPKLIFNYYPTAGLGYYALILFYIASIPYSLGLLFKKIQKSQGLETKQLKFIVIAAILGFVGGGVAFLPTFNILILPVSVILFSIYPVIIAYAILKHHLFDLKLILVELAILLLNLFLFLNVFTSHGKTDLVLNASVSVAILVFSIFLVRGIYKDTRDRERIGELAYKMEVANEKLRMLEGQKTEFVSIASHQLRTPLTVIKGYASMVLEGTFGRISDEARDAMEKLYKSSERIVTLVEDLLIVSRIEQGIMMLVFEKVNFKDFVQSVISETEEAASEAKIEISFTADEEKEFFVDIDEKKFKQAIKHILENAIKYTPVPGSVKINVTDDTLTKKVRLTVSDTGVGMTSEQITAIFERFNLKENASEKEEYKGGHLVVTKEEEDAAESEMMEKRTPGIGLYIAQEIIEAHHGTIHIKSAGQGSGTTVVVELPRVEEVRSS